MQSPMNAPSASSITDSILEQLERLKADTDMTSASDFAVAQRWEGWNTRLGLTVVGCAACVTALGAFGAANLPLPFVLDANRVILGCTILGALTAMVGSVLTFLKPAERASRYREFGNKQRSLRNRIRMYRTVSIFYAIDQHAVHEQLVAFLNEKDALNSDNPPLPKWAFARASRDIEDKNRRRQKRLGWPGSGSVARTAVSGGVPALG